MSLRTFKLRMRKQGFSTFPSKGARSINRAIREVEGRLLGASAEALDDGGTRERLEGRLEDCLAERKRFLSKFERKFATRDRGLVVAPSQSFLNLRKRLGKWRQKAQRRAVRQLTAEGLSAEALSGRGAGRAPPPPPAPAPAAGPARAGRAGLPAPKPRTVCLNISFKHLLVSQRGTPGPDTRPREQETHAALRSVRPPYPAETLL